MHLGVDTVKRLPHNSKPQLRYFLPIRMSFLQILMVLLMKLTVWKYQDIPLYSGILKINLPGQLNTMEVGRRMELLAGLRIILNMNGLKHLKKLRLTTNFDS